MDNKDLELFARHTVSTRRSAGLAGGCTFWMISLFLSLSLSRLGLSVRTRCRDSGGRLRRKMNRKYFDLLE